MKKASKSNSKSKKVKNNSVFSSDNEMAKLMLLIVIVAIAFAIFYVITLFVVKKKDEKTTTPTDTPTEATIQYQKILASNVLSQNEKEYYVLAYKNDDKYVESYKNNLTYYSMTKEDSVPYYYIELDNTFNKEFLNEKSKLNVEKAKDIRFSQTTLLRIKEGKIVSTYEGKDNIVGKLDRMSK